MLDMRDVFRLVVSAGLSAAIFMGFWFLSVKYRNPAFKAFAWFFGLSPFGMVALVILGRELFGHGVIHVHETWMRMQPPGEVKEVEVPVKDAALEHLLELRPAAEVVGMKTPSGEDLPVTPSKTLEDGVSMVFVPRGEGVHVLRLKAGAGVERVQILAKEIR